MKLLTSNFLTCAVKACKSSPSSYPLHFREATLERREIAFNPLFLTNILPRINWDALSVNVGELGLEAMMPDRQAVEEVEQDGYVERDLAEGEQPKDEMEVERGAAQPGQETTSTGTQKEEILRKLHLLLLETGVVEGKLVCGNCGFEYPIKDGVGNFLLPPHLV